MTESVEKNSEKIEDVFDSIKEKAEDRAEELKTEKESLEESVKNSTKDAVETVQAYIDEREDELETIPVRGHAPSIPQYVPKNYTRETQEEANDAGVRGSVRNDGYNGYPPIDDVQPAPNGVKNAAEEKSTNTVLWIVLGILIVLCITGCCMVQAFFGIIKALGG